MSSLINRATYDEKTHIYTSPTGGKMSMSLDNAKKMGAVIVNPFIKEAIKKTKKSSHGSSSSNNKPNYTPVQLPTQSSSSKPSLLDKSGNINIIRKDNRPSLLNLQRNRATYDEKTHTYTSPTGGKMSMSLDNAKKMGAMVLANRNPNRNPNMNSGYTAVPTKKYRVITTGGNVKIIKNNETVTYRGNAYIPELKMTANQFTNKLERTYNVSPGRYRYDNEFYSDIEKVNAQNLKNYKELQESNEIKTLGITYKEFQNALKKQILPKGYSFVYSKNGDIIAISGPTYQVGLEQLPAITPFLLPELKKVYDKNRKFFYDTGKIANAPDLKGLSTLSIKKYNNKINDQRYIEYKKLGGKLEKDKYLQEVLSNSQDKIIKQSIANELKYHISNPVSYGELTRVNLLLAAITGAGASLKTTASIGAAYGGTIGFASDIAKNQYNLNLNETLKLAAKNYGIGAAQGLMAGLIFKGVGKTLKSVSKTVPVVFGEVAGKTINNTAKKIIENGLNYIGLKYITNTSYKMSGYLKNIAIGDKEYGIKGVSKTAGQISGFALSNIPKIVKKIKNMKYEKKLKELNPYIQTAQKFKRGYANNDYLKIKNAQPKDFKDGRIKIDRISIGRLNKLPISQQKEIINMANKNGIKLNTDSEIYVQQIRIKSNVPKMDAYIKFMKSYLTNKPLKTIPKYSDFSTYTRYGIVYNTQVNNGVVKSFAIEWSKSNGKITNIGFKSGEGYGTKAFVKNYMKTRTIDKTLAKETFKLNGKNYKISITTPAIKGRLSDVYIVKGKNILHSKNNFIINKYDIKKAYINGKPLSSKQSILIKEALMKDYKNGNSKNIESFLSKMYKSKSFLKTQKVYDIRLVSKSNDIFNTKYYVSRSKSILNIPKNPKTIIEAPKIKRISNLKYDSSLNSYIPKNKQQIQTKLNSITVKQTKKILDTAIKNTQTIIRPKIKTSTLLKPKYQVNLLNNLGVLYLYSQKVSQTYSSKLLTSMKQLSKLLNIQMTNQALTTSQIVELKNIQLSTLKMLDKTINQISVNIPKIIIPKIIPPKININHDSIIKLPKLNLNNFQSIKKRANNLSNGFMPKIIIKNKTKPLSVKPLTFKKALSKASYNLLNSRYKYSVLVPDNRKYNKSILERNIKEPNDYFLKNRNKFRLHYNNNNKLFYLIKK